MQMNGIEFGVQQLGVLTFRLKGFSTWPSHFSAYEIIFFKCPKVDIHNGN
jgi:hypothetical protein